MKIVSNIARYLLGAMFTVFGLNGFLHFIKQPPPESALAGQFMGAAFESHYMMLIFAAQLIAGVLLLADCYAPFALVVLAAVIVNILNYHVNMDPGGIQLGLVATVLWIASAVRYRTNYNGLFALKAQGER